MAIEQVSTVSAETAAAEEFVVDNDMMMMMIIQRNSLSIQSQSKQTEVAVSPIGTAMQ